MAQMRHEMRHEFGAKSRAWQNVAIWGKITRVASWRNRYRSCPKAGMVPNGANVHEWGHMWALVTRMGTLSGKSMWTHHKCALLGQKTARSSLK